MTLTYYNPNLHSLADLVNFLLVQNSGLFIDTSTIKLNYGSTLNGESVTSDATSLSFYDGTLNLGIDPGLLLTSGDGAPPLENTSSSYSVSFGQFDDQFYDQFDDLLSYEDFDTLEEYLEYFDNLELDYSSGNTTDPDLEATINAAFSGAGAIYDLTSLEFSFSVTDPLIKGVRFDVIFGSDEYPEFMDSSFVDVAGVYVNGTNYALFNQSLSQPLSVLGTNQIAGNFRGNQSGQYAIEYNGLTSLLQVVAPVTQGLNTIKIAIADTGDSILDSGIFIANLGAVEYAGFGLAESIVIPDESLDAPVFDGTGNQVYEFLGGKNSIIIEGGNDIVKGGPGFTSVILPYSLADVLDYSYASDSNLLTVFGSVGITEMIDVARLYLADLLVALDTQVGGNTWSASVLLNAAFGSLPEIQTLSQWVAQADEVQSLTELGQKMIDFYAPSGVSNDELVTLLFQNLVGVAPTIEELSSFVSMIGSGKEFESQADLFAYAAELDLNQGQMVDLIGNLVVLDAAYF